MDEKIIVICALVCAVIFSALALASSDCVTGRDQGLYSKVEVLPAQKLIGEIITVEISDVREDEPMTGKSVFIYFDADGNPATKTDRTTSASGSTNNQGLFTFVVSKAGMYFIEAAGRSARFNVLMIYTPDVLGAVCGNDICEENKLETNENCPVDCPICGDGLCWGFENWTNCPEDCVVCGDGICQPDEYTRTEIFCVEDCVICGDEICDNKYGETSSTCPADCGTAPVTVEETDLSQMIGDYWWVIVAAVALAVVAIIIYKKKGAGSSPKKKKSQEKEEPDEVEEIVGDLLDNGVSESRIRSKLGEYGIDELDAQKIIRKSKK